MIPLEKTDDKLQDWNRFGAPVRAGDESSDCIKDVLRSDLSSTWVVVAVDFELKSWINVLEQCPVFY